MDVHGNSRSLKYTNLFSDAATRLKIHQLIFSGRIKSQKISGLFSATTADGQK
jgi:hypothetical protein